MDYDFCQRRNFDLQNGNQVTASRKNYVDVQMLRRRADLQLRRCSQKQVPREAEYTSAL